MPSPRRLQDSVHIHHRRINTVIVGSTPALVESTHALIELTYVITEARLRLVEPGSAQRGATTRRQPRRGSAFRLKSQNWWRVVKRPFDEELTNYTLRPWASTSSFDKPDAGRLSFETSRPPSSSCVLEHRTPERGWSSSRRKKSAVRKSKI